MKDHRNSVLKHFGFALLVLTMGYCHQARAAYAVTDLTYTVGSQTLSGYSGTYLDYYEVSPHWECIFTQWVYFPGFGEQGVEICTDATLDYSFAEVAATEYNPSGNQVSYRYGYSTPSAAVGFPNFNSPQGGTWYAYGDHYVQVERDWCTLAPVWNNGQFGYQPTGCSFLYNYGNYLGTTYDAVAFGSPPPPPPGIVDVEYTMSIPFNNIRFPTPAFPFFAGDDYESYPGGAATYRIQQKFQIDTASKTVQAIYNLSGITYKYPDENSLSTTASCFRKNGPAPTYIPTLSIIHLGNCRVIGTATCALEASDQETMQVDVTSTTAQSVEVRFQGDPDNACVPFAYDISWDNRIVISWDSGGKYSLDLNHDGFPNHQLRINGVWVYEHDVLFTNQTPLSLGFPKEIEFTTSGPQPLP